MITNDNKNLAQWAMDYALKNGCQAAKLVLYTNSNSSFELRDGKMDRLQQSINKGGRNKRNRTNCTLNLRHSSEKKIKNPCHPCHLRLKNDHTQLKNEVTCLLNRAPFFVKSRFTEV